MESVKFHTNKPDPGSIPLPIIQFFCPEKPKFLFKFELLRVLKFSLYPLWARTTLIIFCENSRPLENLEFYKYYDHEAYNYAQDSRVMRDHPKCESGKEAMARRETTHQTNASLCLSTTHTQINLENTSFYISDLSLHCSRGAQLGARAYAPHSLGSERRPGRGCVCGDAGATKNTQTNQTNNTLSLTPTKTTKPTEHSPQWDPGGTLSKDKRMEGRGGPLNTRRVVYHVCTTGGQWRTHKNHTASVSAHKTPQESRTPWPMKRVEPPIFFKFSANFF